ncbi:MAG: glycyl-radical enzyme activating protein [Candidatus Saliniplasma sp.]
MVKGTIFDIKRFAVHDGPGVRTTVFLKGCPMACQWCHNPEGIDKNKDLFYYQDRCIVCGECIEICQNRALSGSNEDEPYILIDRERCSVCGSCSEVCPTGALKIAGDVLEVKNILDIIKRSKLFYQTSGGGVTFSGGEPFAQYGFLKSLLERCKEEGIHVAVDTSGHVEPDKFEKLMNDIDLFLYDLKIIDEKRHVEYTGITNRYALHNLKKLSEKGRGKDVWIRFPAVPGVTTTKSNLDGVVTFLSELKGIKRISILPFHDVEEKYKKLGKPYLLSCKDIHAPTKEEIDEIASRFREEGFEVNIGG